jgi:hypothetical protein
LATYQKAVKIEKIRIHELKKGIRIPELKMNKGSGSWNCKMRIRAQELEM